MTRVPGCVPGGVTKGVTGVFPELPEVWCPGMCPGVSVVWKGLRKRYALEGKPSRAASSFLSGLAKLFGTVFGTVFGTGFGTGFGTSKVLIGYLELTTFAPEIGG